MIQEKLVIATICCLLYAGTVGIQSSEISNSERKWFITQRNDPSFSTLEKAHPLRQLMQSVQKLFDETGFSHIQQDAFIARVLNVRKLSPSDTLVGQVTDDNSDVVILGIIASGREDGSFLKKGSVIAYPVKDIPAYWESLMTHHYETIFELYRFRGKIEIRKFGC